MRSVIYTAIFGNYDELKQPAVQDADCDFICFTDQRLPARVGAWNVVHVKTRAGMHPRMQASDQIAPPQLAVDGEIEQRQLSHLPLDLEPGSYGPDMLLPQGGLGPINLPLFQGIRFGAAVAAISFSCMVATLRY